MSDKERDMYRREFLAMKERWHATQDKLETHILGKSHQKMLALELSLAEARAEVSLLRQLLTTIAEGVADE